jgi:Polyketide cyclase / dehydrase and lipid transport
MSENEQQVEASPEEVFAILADGWTYADWVVGAARIQSVDPGWPQPGCSIRHSVGAWPLLIDDSTTVEERRQPEYLRLKVRAWPTGEGRVEFFVEPNGTGSLVRMREAPVSGPAKLLPRAITDPALCWRNTETLRRLRFLAERQG